jgi:hypothetical protein
MAVLCMNIAASWGSRRTAGNSRMTREHARLFYHARGAESFAAPRQRWTESCLAAEAQLLADGRKDAIRRRGLRQKGIAPALLRPRLILGKRARGDGDDRNVAVRKAAAEPADEFPAVYERHPKIQNDDIRVIRDDLPQRIACVGQNLHIEPKHLQVFGVSLAAVTVIVDDQAARHADAALQEIGPNAFRGQVPETHRTQHAFPVILGACVHVLTGRDNTAGLEEGVWRLFECAKFWSCDPENRRYERRF